MTMTLQQFIDSRVYYKDLNQVEGYAMCAPGDGPASGWIFADGCGWIEDGPEGPCLTIENWSQSAPANDPDGFRWLIAHLYLWHYLPERGDLHDKISRARLEDDLDASLRPIMDMIGQTDGGYAGVYFSVDVEVDGVVYAYAEDAWPHMDADDKETMLRDWLEAEVMGGYTPGCVSMR